MFKKSFKLILMGLFIIPTMLLCACTVDLTSCSREAGTSEITFEAWGGIGPSPITCTSGLEIKQSHFTAASKYGYNFLYWCYNKDLTARVTFPTMAKRGKQTFYAKYEIDSEVFTNNSRVINWYNDQPTITMDLTATTSYTSESILIDDMDLMYNLLDITIIPDTSIPGQGFSTTSLVLSDEMGRIVEDVNSDPNVFEPAVSSSLSYNKYVLNIIGSGAGSFTIYVNGELMAQ